MKKILIIIALMYFWPMVKAQDMSAFFVGMPDEMIPQLEDAWRKDLVDLYRSGKTASLNNTMNGRSTLEKLTQDYLMLHTTEFSTVEMKFLPLINDTYIVCIVTTVSAPAPDSRIAFYTVDWKPLDARGLWSPPEGEWYIRNDVDRNSEAFHEAVSYFDISLIHYRLSADSLILSAEYSTPQYLSSDVRDKVTPFLMESPKIWLWRNGRFEGE